MKHFLLLMSLLGSFMFCNGQNLSDFSSIQLKSKEDFNPAANEAALKASSYLLSTPADSTSAMRQQASRYLIMWMTGTPDYSFSIDGSVVKITGNNQNLLAVMIAAMADYELKNQAQKNDVDKVKLNTVKKVIEYATNPANKIEPENELKEAIKADKKGQLDKYLATLDK